MNHLTYELTKMMQPVAALITYKHEDEYHQAGYYLEMRSIGKSGRMGAGKPVSNKFINSLVNNFSSDAHSMPHGCLPKEMLFADARTGREKYVWFSPPCKRYMYFKECLNIPNGEYALPGLVWHAEGDSLNLYACKAKKLTGNTPLFSAPFFNVSSNGSVCLGNANLPKPENPTFQNLVKYWEDKFFLSEFSHLLGGNPTRNQGNRIKRRNVFILK